MARRAATWAAYIHRCLRSSWRVGTILPALTGILPWLTSLAAVGLAITMLLAAGFHAMRREYRSIVFNVILLALTAFVAYGRWALAPL